MPILLVRHGETIDNAQRILQTPESPLSENGITQAKLLATRLKTKNVQRVICSDHHRTQQTAQCIQEQLKLDTSAHKELRERSFGDWRGLAHDAFDFNPFDHSKVPPNGESISDFHQRISNAWQLITDIAAQTDGDLLVITHGLVCKALVENHVHLKQDMAVPSHWGNTALSIIEQSPPWTAIQLNCTAHLTEQLNKATDDGAIV